MTEQLQLFDPNEYGPGTRPRSRPERPEVPVEALAPGYTYVRDSRGVLPHAHLIAAEHSYGLVTVCGRRGTKLSNAGVEVMRRCPECDIAAQL